MEADFTEWLGWADRSSLPGLSLPGVYAIAISVKDISHAPFSWSQDIAYIGMTNSKGGLRQRLGQFDQTIKGRSGHGGAERFRFKHAHHEELPHALFVAVRPFECDVDSNAPSDLRTMGEVAAFEYECFAQYVEVFGRLPEFNDKQRSPKK